LTEDVEYWVPSWLNEYDLVTDPNRELSLIYHVSRSQLLERIARIESHKSITALPLPRTLHMIANVDVTASAPDSLHVRSCWNTHIYDPRTFKQWLNFGTYEHQFSKVDGNWLIRNKKIVLMNDRIQTVIDFYSI
jgi:benzoate/toluate 1,2-dioxygenase beta subunit/2,4,5-trichlorophenoxyacetic acid oxygenase 2